MRYFPGMGIFSKFSSRKDESATAAIPTEVDLGTFRIGDSQLGKAPMESDFFTAGLESSDTFENESSGLEVGTKDGVVDYVFLTLEKFAGTFRFDGTPLEIGTETTEMDVREQFGEPYWVDRSDGETILFYEYDAGAIELQFEFPEAEGLGFVTISRNGVLSEAEQRKSYGVDKPWPP